MKSQLQRYYSLWKDCNAMYDEWSKRHGLSSSKVLLLYSLYESEEICTQKILSAKWNIPKQTVNTILQDFQKKGYVKFVTSQEDQRHKLIYLTEFGRQYANDVIGNLHKNEMYVIEKMGFESIKSLNDNLELFIRLFSNKINLHKPE